MNNAESLFSFRDIFLEAHELNRTVCKMEKKRQEGLD